MLCLQHLEVRNYSVANSDGEGASLTSKAEALFVSVIHGSQEKRTAVEKAWDQDGRFEWKAPKVELWDGESGETVEFIVSVERNGVRWRDSMATFTMGDFRRRPEHRHTLEKQLVAIGGPSASRDAEASKGTLSAVLTYTEDCVQPSLFQSLFCTAFIQCGGGLDSLSMELGDYFLPFLSAKTRAQQRLLERDWAYEEEEEEVRPSSPSLAASAMAAGAIPVPALASAAAQAED